MVSCTAGFIDCKLHGLCLRMQAIIDLSPCMQAEGRRRLLVRGGTVVNADRKLEADVYCEDGIIR